MVPGESHTRLGTEEEGGWVEVRWSRTYRWESGGSSTIASLRIEDRRVSVGASIEAGSAEEVPGPTPGKFCRKDAYRSSSGFWVLRLLTNMVVLVSWLGAVVVKMKRGSRSDVKTDLLRNICDSGSVSGCRSGEDEIKSETCVLEGAEQESRVQASRI